MRNYREKKAIVDKLTDQERKWLCPDNGGVYKDVSDFVVYYSKVFLNVGFIDVYKPPTINGDGLILIAVAPEARGERVATRLMDYAYKACKNKGLKRLVWIVDHGNEVSEKVIASYGYDNHKSFKDREEYYINLD